MATAVPLDLKRLDQLRSKSKQVFDATPAPAKEVETWRRNDFNFWRADSAPASGRPMDEAALSSLVPKLDELRRHGVVIQDLREAFQKYGRWIEPCLEPKTDGPLAKLELLNQALWSQGVFVHIPPGLEVPIPIGIRFGESGPSTHSFPRLIVAAGPESRSTLVREHFGKAGRSVVCSDVLLEPGARLDVSVCEDLEPDSGYFSLERCRLERDAHLSHSSVALGAAVHKSHLEVSLSGQGARSEIFGLVFGGGKQHFDLNTKQHHLGKHTTSDLLYRTALQGQARSIYTGMVRIEREATQTEAYQSNHNLLLSSQARADTTPILEILTDAVHCKHGATAGPVSEEELYYLAARGVDPKSAVQILALAFAEPVFKRLPEGLREMVYERIEGRLRDLEEKG
ncbi:MAG: SufD family Fe-S cluster assembly protein [Elusimicrobia bacterium]|nr:SufD family Fe-S cluster assembly protein [Elusimicrobiota bacterium]